MILRTTARQQAPQGTVLHVVGEVDTLAAEGLHAQLRRLGPEPPGVVVVDFSQVTFMSCAALAVLARAKAQLGTRLLLGGRSRLVNRLLELTGLTSYFPVLEGNGTGRVRDGSADGRAPAARTAEAATWTLSRTDVHRARGMLMAVHGCDADQAWSMLALAAARHGVPVAELVELLVRSRHDPDGLPSSAAAMAALAVLTREPLGAPSDTGEPAGAMAAPIPDRPAERLSDT